jgi:hypothetical protein
MLEMTRSDRDTRARSRWMNDAFRHRPHAPETLQVLMRSHVVVERPPSAQPSGHTTASTAGRTAVKTSKRIAQCCRTGQTIVLALLTDVGRAERLHRNFDFVEDEHGYNPPHATTTTNVTSSVLHQDGQDWKTHQLPLLEW